ncbi:MAG: PAS domain-containing protein, partial [Luteibaculum sp.]
MSLPNKSFYWRNQVINYGLVLIFCTGIFILDFYSPRGLAIGMLYCIVVLYSWLIPGKYVTPLLTLAVSILLLVAGVGGGQPPLQATENYLALNKILSLIAIWITASVVSLAKRSLERLELSKANLELKILARTRELRKSEETFRLMVNELKNHALILLNQRGEIEQWNTAATALTGYSESEVLAQHYKLFFEKEYLEIQAPSQMLFKALDEGKFVGEGWVLGKDNKRIWSEITVIPILGLKSSHNGFILLASDLSERRVKDRLKLSNAVLKAKKGELEQFVFAASHNLQEPLRNIKLLSSHLQ